MSSPFPGMDPYLEGQLWADFHHTFITSVRAALMPILVPRYIALIQERVYLEHTPDPLSRAVYPDVAVIQDRLQTELPSMEAPSAGTAVMAEPITMPILMPEEIIEPYIEIRLRDSQELITVIEILSPTNKSTRSDGYREYLLKRDQVLAGPIHLVELDLLRGGKRMPMRSPLPPADYYAVLSRSSQRPASQVWPILLRQRLPFIPVPLSNGDKDVQLDLQACFDVTYNQAYYGSILNYQLEIYPPLSPEDALWAETLLR